MGQNAFFKVKNHGHEYPKDAPGIAGAAFKITQCGKGIFMIKHLTEMYGYNSPVLSHFMFQDNSLDST
jgi:hypothetical protein